MKTIVRNGITLKFKGVVPCENDIQEIANLLLFKAKYKKQNDLIERQCKI